MRYTPKIAPWPSEFADKIPVSEIFCSIQGEGRFAGTPSVFIRLKYCNLGCAWCDTRFTWDQGKIEEGELCTAEQIADKSRQLLGKHNSESRDIHIVITGGEPMLHQDRIPGLIDVLRTRGFEFFEIETNGMYLPSLEMLERISWWNCSPKLRNNGLSPSINIVNEALQAIKASHKADFKFVVQLKSDIEEIISDYVPLIGNENIILMPEGITPESQIRKMEWIMEACGKHGFRFSPRLQILLWGSERAR